MGRLAYSRDQLLALRGYTQPEPVHQCSPVCLHSTVYAAVVVAEAACVFVGRLFTLLLRLRRQDGQLMTGWLYRL